MMWKILFGIIFLVGIVTVTFAVFEARPKQGSTELTVTNQEATDSHPQMSTKGDEFASPLEHALKRVTKKAFGVSIDPKTSPVQPERFAGYHTGVDFETFPEEASTDVLVRAICDGVLIVKRTASGYGGVIVESCLLDGSPMTVVYGHLNLTSITSRVGDTIKQGQILGNLGKGYSSETDGERKHLHLGIHKGAAINIMGYVNKKSALADWVDPCLFICVQ